MFVNMKLIEFEIVNKQLFQNIFLDFVVLLF